MIQNSIDLSKEISQLHNSQHHKIDWNEAFLISACNTFVAQNRKIIEILRLKLFKIRDFKSIFKQWTQADLCTTQKQNHQIVFYSR